MGQKFIITEEDRKRIKRLYMNKRIMEQDNTQGTEQNQPTSPQNQEIPKPSAAIEIAKNDNTQIPIVAQVLAKRNETGENQPSDATQTGDEQNSSSTQKTDQTKTADTSSQQTATQQTATQQTDTQQTSANTAQSQSPSTSQTPSGDYKYTYPGDKNWIYAVKDNKWWAKNKTSGKEFDITIDKYKDSSIKKLDSQYPDARTKEAPLKVV